MIEETAVYAVASSCPTWSVGSKLSSAMLSLRMTPACAAPQLWLAHRIDGYIRRETAQKKLPDQIIHRVARDTDQAIG